jgi:hypothetical protein
MMPTVPTLEEAVGSFRLSGMNPSAWKPTL